eukprot:scpid99788/ scgid17190/ 
MRPAGAYHSSGPSTQEYASTYPIYNVAPYTTRSTVNGRTRGRTTYLPRDTHELINSQLVYDLIIGRLIALVRGSMTSLPRITIGSMLSSNKHDIIIRGSMTSPERTHHHRIV